MKPSLPKGTRDFSPDDMVRRNYIFDTIRGTFQRYGFRQIETPALEQLSVLEGKYGEEGDRLLFRILNSGPLLDNLSKPHAGYPAADITEKGLRYDLTVPFARYVVMHQNELTFPFRRYQVQPVWRADRPQKGRYREFYQCDADIIGSPSLLNEAELVGVIRDVFAAFQLDVVVRLNNRKILAGIADVIGASARLTDITVAIDKLDKIGRERVDEELRQKGLPESAIARLGPVLELTGGNEEKLSRLHELLGGSATGMTGITEMETVLSWASRYTGPGASTVLDLTLARGLNYYTGTIIEVTVNDKRSSFSSSVCGGGRYDDLTGIFGLPGVSGVGISFGADRIYDVLEEVSGFPDFSAWTSRILFANFGEAEALYCLQLVRRLRDDGVAAELYPDTVKMAKQLKYADAKKIPYVALIGTEEMKTGEITVKNMRSGEQSMVTLDELLHMLK